MLSKAEIRESLEDALHAYQVQMSKEDIEQEVLRIHDHMKSLSSTQQAFADYLHERGLI